MFFSIRIPAGPNKEILTRDWEGGVGESTGTLRLLQSNPGRRLLPSHAWKGWGRLLRHWEAGRQRAYRLWEPCLWMEVATAGTKTRKRRKGRKNAPNFLTSCLQIFNRRLPLAKSNQQPGGRRALVMSQPLPPGVRGWGRQGAEKGSKGASGGGGLVPSASWRSLAVRAANPIRLI